MALSKLTVVLNKISTLATTIRGQSSTVKAAFDHDVNEIKDYINNTLTTEIDALDSANIKKTGDQTIDGVKTFVKSPIVPTPTTDMQTSTKKYVDDKDTSRKTYIDDNFTTKNEISNTRKLSVTGDFTGTWNGRGMVETDPGIQAIVNEHASQLAQKVYYFYTLANMKESTKLRDGDMCSTLGYYSVNDGGCGSYRIRTKLESDTDNGGNIIVIGTTLVAELITSGSVTVKQFGAKGDDINDDILHIQAAVNNFDTVVFPYGTYDVSLPIVVNKEMSIEGISSHAYGRPIIKYVGTTGNINVIEVNNHLTTIKNICIDGNSCDVRKTGVEPTTGAPTLYYGYYETLQGITGIKYNGSVYNSILENVHVLRCSGYGVYSGVFLILDKINAEYCNKGMFLNTDTTASNLRASYNACGYEIDGSGIQITNIRADECVYHGITAKGSYISMTNAFVDQIGYSGLNITGNLSYSDIHLTCLRCGTYWYNNTFASVPDANKWQSCVLSIKGNVDNCDIGLIASSYSTLDDAHVDPNLKYGLIVNTADGNHTITRSTFHILPSKVRGDVSFIMTSDLGRHFTNFGIVTWTLIDTPTSRIVYQNEDKINNTPTVVTVNGFRYAGTDPTTEIGMTGTIHRFGDFIYIPNGDYAVTTNWTKIAVSV